MKTHFSTLFFTVFLTLFAVTSNAQQDDRNIDRERMNRDIRIMVSTLDEIFRVDNGSSFSFSMPGFTLGSRSGSGSINGRYLPGYGIIFSIPDVTGRSVGIFSTSGAATGINQENKSFVFSTKTNGDGNTIDEEGIKARVQDFLVNYAPSIGQLNNDDNILVVYGALSSDRRIVSVHTDRVVIGRNDDTVRVTPDSGGSSADESDETVLPIISMLVQKRDLEALRNGSISESAFINRIDTFIRHRDGNGRFLDLEVFANVLDTGLSEGNSELFRMTRKPDHLYLENFGVIYHVNFNRSPAFIWGDLNKNIDFRFLSDDMFDVSESFQFDLEDFRVDIDSIRVRFQSDFLSDEDREKMREQMDKTRENIEAVRQNLEERLPEIREKQEEARRRIEAEREKLQEQYEKAGDPEKVRESLDNRIRQIKELIIDYGGTLSTLKDGQSLLVTINTGVARNSGLPERVDLRVTKSDLLQLARGTISRDQAMDRIVETRN